MFQSFFSKIYKASKDSVMKVLSGVLGGFVFLEQRFTPHSKNFWAQLKDHFIPHKGNEHKPNALRHGVLVSYSVFLIILKVVSIILPVALPSSSLYSSAITVKNVVDLTNQTRANLGLNELKLNTKLTVAAQAKADDMMTNQYFAHVSPQGVTPWYWFDKAGYDYMYAGENLAVHYEEAETLHAGWLASPTHKANIVNSHYTDIGIGVAMGNFEGVESTVVVQEFGQPVAVLAEAAKTPTKTSEPVKKVTTPTIVNKVTEPAKTTVVTKPIVTSTPPVKTESKPETVVPVSKPVESTSVEPINVEPENLLTDQPVEIPASIAGSVSIGEIDTAKEVLSSTAVEPVIYDNSLIIKQTDDSTYSVKLAVTGATSVAVKLASEWVMLSPISLGSMWQGAVPFDKNEFSQSGEQLSVVVWGKDGVVINKPVAWVAPSTPVQKLYTFNEGSDKYAKLFGFVKIHNLQDSVKQFYFYFMIFLAAALLLNVFIKIRIQHFSIISHALLVLALTLFLTIV